MRVVLFAFAVLSGIAGCSSDSGGEIADPPPIPASVVATPGNERVIVEWSGVSNAMVYNLHWSTDANFSTASVTTINDVRSPYTHTQLSNGTAYYYAVTAVGQGGESRLSAIAQAIPVAPPGPDSVMVTASNEQVTIEWPSIPGAITYNLHWSTDPDFNPENVTTINNVSSPYNHTQLSNDTDYYYAVTVVFEDGESQLSVVSQASPIPPPGKPSQMTLTATTADVTLQWSGVADATSYSLYLAAEPYISKENIRTLQGWAIVDNVSSPYTHPGLIPGVTYFFALVAENAGGLSILSNELPGMLLPEAPSVDNVTALDKRATIEWSNVTGAQSYNLYIASEPGVIPGGVNSMQDGRTLTNVASPLTIDGLVNGKTYYFIITALNASGESSASTEVETTPVNLTPVAVGMDHTCAIREDNSLWCWGFNREGQLGLGSYGVEFSKTRPTRVGGSNNWNYVAAGGENSCGVQTDGSLWCWGANYDGQIGDGTDGGINRKLEPTQISATDTWSEIAVGNYHVCALSDSGQLQCWGYGGDGQIGNGSWTTPVNLPASVLNSDLPWLMVSAGDRHSCAIKSNNTLWCWGRGADGRLGDGFTTDRNTPTIVAGEWSKVAAGGSHTCAIRSDGALRCWGDNEFGQLGNGLSGFGESSSLPDVVNSAVNWTDITAGSNFTCGIKLDGTLWCWGQNYFGQIGQGDSGGQDTHDLPTQIGTETQWRSVKASGTGDHVCAYKQDDSFWCWGDNGYGQLGEGSVVDGTNQYSLVPVPVNPDTDWASISLGYYHSCAIKENGSLWCWGDNTDGTVGDGSQLDKSIPVQVGSDLDWKQVSANSEHTCAVKTTGSLWCWGNNGGDDILGLGPIASFTVLPSPQQLGTDTDWEKVSTGTTHSCALKTNGSIYCWGNGASGRLAQDSTDTADKDIPVPIISSQAWLSVSAGYMHTCAVATDNSLWCWGSNSNGATGQGTSSSSLYLPAPVGLDMDWLNVNSGMYYTCGIKTAVDVSLVPTHQLLCWGDNDDGQTGDGTASTILKLDPGVVAGDPTDWRAVSAYRFHTCGVKYDNTLWCWGNNEDGSVGNNIDDGNSAGIPTPTPQQIGDAEWEAVEVGGFHTCAIKQNGTLWCWGRNTKGQLGNGSAWSGDPLLVRFQ